MRRVALIPLLFLLVAVTAPSHAVSAAPAGIVVQAYAWDYWTPAGRHCEAYQAGDLAKIVCRDPRNFNLFSVLFFGFQGNVVFLDRFEPANVPGGYMVSQEQISPAVFWDRYGPR